MRRAADGALDGAEALGETIEEAYAVFARHPLAARIEGCPHCVTEEDQRELRSAPLRELGAQQLRRFTGKAVTTWGDVDDLRHFLPRMIELGMTGDGDLHAVAGRLRLVRWWEWPADERAAVRGCLEAVWRDVLGREPGERSAGHVLDTLAAACDDLAPFLDAWPENPGDQAALRQLTGLVREVVHTPPRARNPQVVAWLLSRRSRMEELFFEVGDPDLAAELSDARECLDHV